MAFFIGTILRYALGYIGLHGTYVVLATIAISATVGMYLKQKFNLGGEERRRRR
jgi:hypothetical protein